MAFLNELLSFILEWFVDKPWAFLVAFVDWVKTLITETLPNVIYQLLPEGTAEYLRTFDLDGIQALIEPVTYFIPFWAIVTIYLNAFVIAAGVRFARWIVGLIPTIEG